MGNICKIFEYRAMEKHEKELDLLKYFQEGKLEKFRECLKSGVNVSFQYDSTDFKLRGSILHIISKDPGDKSEFVKCLLKSDQDQKADPNERNAEVRRLPIHSMVMHGNKQCLQVLLESDKIKINERNSRGETALHLAVENESTDCLEVLLKRRDVNVRVRQNSEKNAVHIAAEKQHLDHLRLLIRERSDDLDLDGAKDNNEKTARETILANCPELEPELPPHRNLEPDLSDSLWRKDIKEMDLGSWTSDELQEMNDGNQFLLQYVTSQGYSAGVTKLLEKGVDPNTFLYEEEGPPLIIAARKGFVKIVGTLCKDSRVNGDSVPPYVLHEVVKGSSLAPGQVDKNEEIDHVKTLEVLLGWKECPKIDSFDKNGNTPLYYAAKQGKGKERELCLVLLKNKSLYMNKQKETAMSYIKPEVIKEFLDGCVSECATLKKYELKYEITVDYNFLPLRNQKEQPEAKETEFFLALASSQRTHHLLNHPVTLLYLSLTRKKVNLLLSINFLICLICTSVLTCMLNRADTSHGNGSITCCQISAFIIFLVLKNLKCLFKCLIQLFPEGRIKRSFEGWIKRSFEGLINIFRACECLIPYCIRLIFIMFKDLDLIVFLMLSCVFTSCSDNIFPALAAIFIARYLFLTISLFPRFAKYLKMFKRVLTNFSYFLGWYSTLTFGFGFSFYILFHEAITSGNSTTTSDSAKAFGNLSSSILRIFVMATGDLNVADVPLNYYIGPSYYVVNIVFLSFVFLITIVMLNILTGLAVGDTGIIQSEAELAQYSSQIKSLMIFEEYLSSTIIKWFNMFRGPFKISIFPNDNTKAMLLAGEHARWEEKPRSHIGRLLTEILTIRNEREEESKEKKQLKQDIQEIKLHLKALQRSTGRSTT